MKAWSVSFREKETDRKFSKTVIAETIEEAIKWAKVWKDETFPDLDLEITDVKMLHDIKLDVKHCNPPEDCKRCAYAPQGSELCRADYAVWIVDDKEE